MINKTKKRGINIISLMSLLVMMKYEKKYIKKKERKMEVVHIIYDLIYIRLNKTIFIYNTQVYVLH